MEKRLKRKAARREGGRDRTGRDRGLATEREKSYSVKRPMDFVSVC